jgi:D-alanyl-D-alanine dipeptidase
MQDFVYIDQYGLLGSNFYWHKYENYGLSKEDIISVGLTDDRVQVHKDIIDVLVGIDKEFQKEFGYRLYIKEGYRSADLYDIVYKRRVTKFGKEHTDKIFNVVDKPHASGKTVDVALWDLETNKEVYMRNWEDSAPALHINFYRNREDEEARKYQDLQDRVIDIMLKHGFRLGTKNEYFHFNYEPDTKSVYNKNL